LLSLVNHNLTASVTLRIVVNRCGSFFAVPPFQFAERLDGHLLASIWEWAMKLNLRAHEGRKARADLDLNKRLIVKRPRGRFCAQQRRNTEVF
jgi:hypothetical protein